MSKRYDCSDPASRAEGIAAAAEALRNGELVVLPTDTVYGIGADAFYPSAVTALLAAKGRGRDMPPPVLVGTVRAAVALVEDFGPFGKDLIDEFWPGGLTIVCRAARSLEWDLGDTRGTVAIRMPLHAVALDLLKETGPLAVSSANRTGQPSATTADEAEQQLGETVSVYLDGGPCTADVSSTIVDLTGRRPRLLRAGAISVGKLREVAVVLPAGAGAAPRDPAPQASPSAGDPAPEASPSAGDPAPEASPSAGDVTPEASPSADDAAPEASPSAGDAAPEASPSPGDPAPGASPASE
jgi:L-threonylcarbamoyladenylate synthase